MRKLPIGIQSFEKMRNDGYLYVDKTPIIKQLHNEGTYYFLSRPRRFGKSLLLDTMRCAFEGKQELFEGLYLYDNWNWEKKHPVLYVNFGNGTIKTSQELIHRLKTMLKAWQETFKITCNDTTISGCFTDLIKKIATTCGERVVRFN
jgi:hypothetical protein